MKTKAIILTIMILAASGGAATITVSLDGSGDYTTIQAAIEAAIDGDEVVVAEGTYTGDGNRDITFNGKAITVQSKNGPENCIIDCQGSKDDTHRGFRFKSGEGADSVVNGFSVINGYMARGAGIFCYESSPTIINCLFRNNFARSSGGAIFSFQNPSLTLSGCIFKNNKADGLGGGLYCDNSDLKIVDCIFENNKAGLGGGLYSDKSDLEIVDCVFESNESGSGGGICASSNSLILKHTVFSDNFAVEVGGGLACNSAVVTILDCEFMNNINASFGGGVFFYQCDSLVMNSYFIGNFARKGGGMYCYHCNLLAYNCVFTGNKTWNWSAGIKLYLSTARIVSCTFAENLVNGEWISNIGYEDNDSLVVSNSILWGGYMNRIDSSIDITFSNFLGDIEGEGNISSAPRFVREGHWDDNGTPQNIIDDVWIDGDYRLRSDSPCIDAGDPEYPFDPNEVDLDGGLRVIDGDGDGEVRIDMGCYEYQPPVVVEVKITPSALNVNSHGRFVVAHIQMPEDLVIVEDDIETILLDGLIEAEDILIGEDKMITTRFDRTAVSDYLIDLGVSGPIELTITGRLTDGTILEGKDAITVKE